MSPRASDPVQPPKGAHADCQPHSIGDRIPRAKTRHRWEQPGRIPALVVLGTVVAALVRYWDRGELNAGNLDMYLVFLIGGGAVIWLLGNVGWTRESGRDSGGTPHSDPNVQALIDGKIDLEEYSRRKSETGSDNAS